MLIRTRRRRGFKKFIIIPKHLLLFILLSPKIYIWRKKTHNCIQYRYRGEGSHEGEGCHREGMEVGEGMGTRESMRAREDMRARKEMWVEEMRARGGMRGRVSG